MYLAERIVITKDVHRQFYELADRNARLAKQLYNAALFRLRQTFTGWEKDVRTENEKEVFRELDLLKERYPKLKAGRVLSYGVLEKLMRVTRNPDFYAGLPMQSAQAVVKSAATDFRNWLAAGKVYRKDPSVFPGRPRMPGYCKSEKKTYTITNQDAVLYPVYEQREDGRDTYAGMQLKFPGTRQRMLLPHLPGDAKLKEVKVRPYYGKYLLILVLEAGEPPAGEAGPEIAGIDLGTDNIAAIVTTDHASRVYKGGAVLSRNRLFHKEKAKAAAVLTKGTSRRHVQSKHLDFLSQKHDCFVRDMMHKISTDIIRFCREHEVGTIVIGTNPLWKQKSKMDAVRNQNFEGIPHAALRWMITYKAQTAGIRVVLQEESYTSKADVTTRDRMPVYGKEGEKEEVFSGKRVGRGRYRCADGSLINADCNGAANILRKAFPDAWDGTDDFRFLAYPGSISFRTLNRSRAAA